MADSKEKALTQRGNLSTSTWRVAPQELRWQCDASTLAFETTEEIQPFVDVIGQDRAKSALDLGLAMVSSGFNFLSPAPRVPARPAP